ncbi:hypothetical protein FQA39_LY08973 [Lamprigera yunnana]|nr:hypothetical protein FQA39_LY08973 [Lamprigera yunnana]
MPQCPRGEGSVAGPPGSLSDDCQARVVSDQAYALAKNTGKKIQETSSEIEKLSDIEETQDLFARRYSLLRTPPVLSQKAALEYQHAPMEIEAEVETKKHKKRKKEKNQRRTKTLSTAVAKFESNKAKKEYPEIPKTDKDTQVNIQDSQPTCSRFKALIREEEAIDINIRAAVEQGSTFQTVQILDYLFITLKDDDGKGQRSHDVKKGDLIVSKIVESVIAEEEEVINEDEQDPPRYHYEGNITGRDTDESIENIYRILTKVQKRLTIGSRRHLGVEVHTRNNANNNQIRKVMECVFYGTGIKLTLYLKTEPRSREPPDASGHKTGAIIIKEVA